MFSINFLLRALNIVKSHLKSLPLSSANTFIFFNKLEFFKVSLIIFESEKAINEKRSADAAAAAAPVAEEAPAVEEAAASEEE